MPRQLVCTFASAASHAAALLLLLLTLQVTRQTEIATRTDIFAPRQLAWIPTLPTNAGKRSGGDRANSPARPERRPGTDEMSIASAADKSSESTVDAPLEPIPVARPMGDAMSSLVGAVSREPGDSRGANTGRGGDGEGPDSFGHSQRVGWPGVTTPVVVTQVKPSYTAEAMRAKVQGLVIVECVVKPDGTVGDARIVRSLDPRFGLDQEAITAAKKWRFKPGLLNGTPVPVIVSIELSFTLR
jgi:periplasmic protein TonB